MCMQGLKPLRRHLAILHVFRVLAEISREKSSPALPILKLNACSRRNTISRKSIELRPQSCRAQARRAVTSSSSTPRASTRAGLNSLEDFVSCHGGYRSAGSREAKTPRACAHRRSVGQPRDPPFTPPPKPCCPQRKSSRSRVPAAPTPGSLARKAGMHVTTPLKSPPPPRARREGHFHPGAHPPDAQTALYFNARTFPSTERQ